MTINSIISYISFTSLVQTLCVVKVRLLQLKKTVRLKTEINVVIVICHGTVQGRAVFRQNSSLREQYIITDKIIWREQFWQIII